MDQIGRYCQKFAEEYLSTPEDRRQLWETLVTGVLTVALIIAAGVVLWDIF